MNTARTFGLIVASAGLWETLAPFIIHYSGTTDATADAVVLGIALLVLGLWTAFSRNDVAVRNLSRIDAVLGIWLIAAPFFIGYSGSLGPLVNDLIVGAVVLVVEAWGTVAAGATIRQTEGASKW